MVFYMQKSLNTCVYCNYNNDMCAYHYSNKFYYFLVIDNFTENEGNLIVILLLNFCQFIIINI